MPGKAQLPPFFEALRFHDRSTEGLQSLSAEEWLALLDTMDGAHLTLALGIRCRGALPEAVSARIERNLASNAARHERLVTAQRQITDAFALRGIKFAVMKGLSQWPYYTDDPRHRPQYDIDLYVPEECMKAASAMARNLGYEPATGVREQGADHLPVLIRKTGWTWKGDYFDPEMPPSLELHYRFWNPQMRFEAGDVSQFWKRRAMRQVGELSFPALDPVDGLSYAALHVVRHLLGGDLRVRHVYELAHFLERSAVDESFWSHWRRTGLQECRVLEGIAFRLAREWFHCDLNDAAREAVDRLPAPIQRWFALFSMSQARGGDDPDKNELWLHFCLMSNMKDCFDVARRRMFPTRRGRVVLDAHVESLNWNGDLELRRANYQTAFLTDRARHHLRSLLPTLRGAMRWYAGARNR